MCVCASCALVFFVKDEEMTRQVFVLIIERIVETGVRFAEWRIVRVLLNCEKRQVFVLITRQRVCVCACVFFWRELVKEGTRRKPA